jgi:Protein of unknown function (DUF2800)
MSDHSIIPPSSGARRRQCSGSTMAEAKYPQTEESPEAKEGTAAHWAASEMLMDRPIDVGLIAPNGQYLTQEMIEGAELYYGDVVRTLAPYGLVPSQGLVEQRLAIPRVHVKSWGTPDYRIWPTRTRLFLYDYKFGFRHVDVFENEQLIEYVAGCLDEMGVDGLQDQHITVTVKIVQPRSPHRDGPIREWTFVASDIRGLINIQSTAAHEALGPSPTFRTGPECRDCAARHACDALQRVAATGCDQANKTQPFDLPVNAMALEYRTLVQYQERMRARISGLEEQLLAHGRRGAAIPGLKIEHGSGRERWTVPDDQVIAIGRALGVDIAKKPEALTPKQAVAAGLTPAVLPGLVNTPRGEAKLVEDDGTLARRIFS